MLIEGIEFDTEGLQALPGLINAHDHLEFALFPRLGRGPYPNATAWAQDVYHPDRSPLADHLSVPKRLRLLWGGLRNLIAGVTTVCHHNPHVGVFEDGFPVRVVERYGWSHSLEFGGDVRAAYESTPGDAPFLVHAGESTDGSAKAELAELDRLGVLRSNTVVIHATGFDIPDWALLRQWRTSVIVCPRSNLFMLGRAPVLPAGVQIALGTDSPLTAEGDLLDEICHARRIYSGVEAMTTSTAQAILRLPDREDDFLLGPGFGMPPEIVVIGGELRLLSPRFIGALAESQRREFFRVEIEGRPPVFARYDIPAWIREAKRHLNSPIRLGGREVVA